MPEITRRDVLAAMTLAGVAGSTWAEVGEDLALAQAAHQHGAASKEAKPTGPRFFQGRELATVSHLADLILPSDETPGAKDAGVAEFLDFYLAGSQTKAQTEFREGLKPFLDVSADRQLALLTELSQKNAPFFLTIRRLTVFGFYTSKIGIQELGYQGNSYASEFPGACTHQHEL